MVQFVKLRVEAPTAMIVVRPPSPEAKTAVTKRQEITYMKKLSFLVLGILITACAETAKPAQQPAVETSSARMTVTGADTVPGHSRYVTLGRVQGKCMENPAAGHLTAADIIADANGLKQAAYRTYGSRVDAVVDADVSYAIEPGEWHPLFDHQGHLECEGTAIHFEEENAPGIAAPLH
jgi:hypothetical protein